MTEVVLRGLVKRFGRAEVIRGVDLTVRSGEFFVLVFQRRIVSGLTAGALKG